MKKYNVILGVQHWITKFMQITLSKTWLIQIYWVESGKAYGGWIEVFANIFGKFFKKFKSLKNLKSKLN